MNWRSRSNWKLWESKKQGKTRCKDLFGPAVSFGLQTVNRHFWTQILNKSFDSRICHSKVAQFIMNWPIVIIALLFLFVCLFVVYSSLFQPFIASLETTENVVYSHDNIFQTVIKKCFLLRLMIYPIISLFLRADFASQIQEESKRLNETR